MLRILFPLFTAAALCWAQAALPKGISKGATVEGITQYKLDNGLTVLLFPDPSKAKVTVNVTYLVGSRHENYGETGMAHLLEHLMFKGTDKHPAIMAQLRDKGAQFNGSTWFDRTNYFETVAASDENLTWALTMEADRMVNSWIAKKDLDSEMTVVRNEYEAGENSAFRVLMQRVGAMAYEWHNYGKSTIGARSDIENVNIERLQAFYRTYYQPDNAVLIVAGKFDEAKALALIGSTFGAIAKPTRKLPALYTAEPTQDGERTVNVRRVGDEQLVLTAHRVPAGTHADFAALSVLQSILADTPTGRLYKALVDNKKAAGIMGMEFQLADPGLIYLGARVRTTQSLPDARAALIETIESAAKEPATAEEVQRAKTKLLKRIELNLADSENVGIDLSEWASMGDWRMLFLHRDRIKKVTAADVQRVAQTYFKSDNRTIGQFLPTAKPDRAEIPATPSAGDLAALVKDYKGTETIAQGEAFDSSPANVESRVRRVQLPNGAKVVMLAKKTRGETVTGRITLRYGDENSLKGRTYDAVFAWQMLMRGSAKHTRQQLQEELDKLKARVFMGGSTQFGTANLTTTRPNLAGVLKLTAEILREPAFPENEFETARQSLLASAESQLSQPQAAAQIELARHLNPYPAGDPRAVEALPQQVASVKAATLDGARKFYREFFGLTPSAVITLVGDFDPAEVEKQLRELFGDWKSPAPVKMVERVYHKTEAINRTIETPDKPNAMFASGFNLPFNEESPDYAALSMAGQIFGSGASSRVTRRLREKEGWSYGAGAGLSIPVKTDGASFQGYAIVAPQNMAKLEAAFREEIAKVHADGFTAEELAKAKQAYQQQRAVMRADDNGLLNVLSSNEYWGRTMNYQAGQEAKVMALTLDQVNAAFRKYIQADALSVVKAGDFKKAAAAPAAQ